MAAISVSSSDAEEVLSSPCDSESGSTTPSQYGAFTFEGFQNLREYKTSIRQRGRIVTLGIVRRRAETAMIVWMMRAARIRRIRKILDVKLSCKLLVDRIVEYL
jgi:hypothetical protein